MKTPEIPADELPAHDPDRWQTTDAAEDSDRTNGMRATEAHDALKHPQALAHEEDFSDLITNLLHFAHSLQHDPESIIRCALANFNAEAGPLPA